MHQNKRCEILGAHSHLSSLLWCSHVALRKPIYLNKLPTHHNGPEKAHAPFHSILWGMMLYGALQHMCQSWVFLVHLIALLCVRVKCVSTMHRCEWTLTVVFLFKNNHIPSRKACALSECFLLRSCLYKLCSICRGSTHPEKCIVLLWAKVVLSADWKNQDLNEQDSGPWQTTALTQSKHTGEGQAFLFSM